MVDEIEQAAPIDEAPAAPELVGQARRDPAPDQVPEPITDPEITELQDRRRPRA